MTGPTEKRRTGDRGETLVADHLEQQGYRILARNWYCRRGELDIVAQKGETVAFVEVKTRREGAMVSPLAAVDSRKQQRIVLAAMLFLQQKGLDLQPRFDVAAVTNTPAGPTLDYLEAAFDAGFFY